MTISLTLTPSLQKHLLATAELLHMPLEEYILSLVEATVPRTVPKIVPAPLAAESDEDFTAAMLSLSRTKTPASLSEETWSRETIYGDHA